jgi:hypothetical protein
MNDFEMKLSMLALETAIERVGAISLQADELRLLPSPNRLIASLELDPHN